MAILDNNGALNGPLGNVRFYTMNGKTVVSTKGGPSAQDVKTKASFAFTRAHNAEFGLISKVANDIYRSHRTLLPIRHNQAYQALRKYLFGMFIYDMTNAHGQRSLLFSKAYQHFLQMQITPERYTDFSLLAVEWTLKDDDEITFLTRSSNGAHCFKMPRGYEQVRWSLYIQGVKDISYNEALQQYIVVPFESILPLTPVASFDFFKGIIHQDVQCTASINKDYNYLVFAVATFTSISKPSTTPIHTASCITVIPHLQE